MARPKGSKNKNPRATRTDGRRVVYKGKEERLVDICKRLGVSPSTVWNRIYRGWEVEKALETPSQRRLVEYRGEAKNLRRWCEELGIGYEMVATRLRLGWSVEEAFTKPNRSSDQSSKVTYLGKTRSLGEWCRELNLPHKTIARRLSRGMSVEEALGTPVRKKEKMFFGTKVVYQGREQPLADWCRELGIAVGTVVARVRRGWGVIEALTKEVKDVGNKRRKNTPKG